MDLNTIKFDWISFSLPQNHDETSLPDLLRELFGLDLAAFQLQDRKRNYYRRSYLLTAPAGDKLVEIFLDPDTEHNRSSTLFQVSGFALSAYASNPLSIDVPELFRRVLSHGGKPTVLHIAMDDTAGRLPWNTIMEMVSPDHYREHIVSTSRRQPITLNNETVYVGQRKDRNSICIYRKDRQEGTKFHWIRVEYRTTDRSTAKAIAEKVAAGEELGPLAAGLIRRFLDFRESSRLTKYNRPSCSWWVDFLGGVEKMIISRDLAPRRMPAMPRKPRGMASVLRDLDRTLGRPDPSSEDYQLLQEWLERSGLIDLARFGDTSEPEEPEPVTDEPEAVAVPEELERLQENMQPVPFDLKDFASEISF